MTGYLILFLRSARSRFKAPPVMRCRRPLLFAPLHAFGAENVRPKVRITRFFVNLSTRMWHYMTENARKSAIKEIESAYVNPDVVGGRLYRWFGVYLT